MDGSFWLRRCRQASCTRASSARLHAHGLEEVIVYGMTFPAPIWARNALGTLCY